MHRWVEVLGRTFLFWKGVPSSLHRVISIAISISIVYPWCLFRALLLCPMVWIGVYCPCICSTCGQPGMAFYNKHIWRRCNVAFANSSRVIGAHRIIYALVTPASGRSILSQLLQNDIWYSQQKHYSNISRSWI